MGQTSLALRTTLGVFGGILALAAASQRVSAQSTDVKPMARDAHPSFEVASIKQSDPDDHSKGFHAMGRNIFIDNETMNDLIAAAYNVHVKQIADGPSWFGSERFDIKGFPDVDGEPNVEQLREMVQRLLTERFHLQLRREQREMPRFTLTVAKGGPKIEATKSAPEDGLPDQTGGIDRGHVFWRFTNNSMTDFAEFLQSVLDRPVVDATGLKGKYDFKLQWTADADATTDPSAAPGFFTAIQEQAGLRMEPSRGEVEVLAVVHAEQPSAN
jgi:uncharacterized protein (TIGR03435 family)